MGCTVLETAPNTRQATPKKIKRGASSVLVRLWGDFAYHWR